MSRSWQRIVLIAPHPDDESLACGGFVNRMARAGARVDVVFATDGEFNHWPQRFLERRWRIGPDDRARWGARRRGEALAALSALGVDPSKAHFLGLPDGAIPGLARRSPDDVKSRLEQAILPLQPDLLLVPSIDDLHGDHQALATTIAQSAPLRDVETFHYLTHGTPNGSRVALRITLDDAELEAKERAILCHRTQLALSRARLTRFLRRDEVFYSCEGARPPRLAALRHVIDICFPSAH